MARSRFDPDRVLNPLRERRIYRKRIPVRENAVSALIALVLLGAGAWVLAQKRNFDPAERDLSSAQLAAASVQGDLYKAPLKRWVDGAAQGSGPVAPGSPAAAPDTGFFPRGILDGGWSLAGRVETFAPDNLYVKIDGGAEQYLALAFRRLYYATLEKGGASFTLEVYDQTDFPNTLGIFAAQRDPGRKLERVGDAWLYRTAVGAIGIAGNHYFKISGNAETPEVRAKADALVPLFAALPSSAPPGGRRLFETFTAKLGVPFEGVAYEKANVFAYDFLGDTWFAKAGPGDARWFAHEAKDAAAAEALAKRLGEEQQSEYALVDGTGTRAVFKHKVLGTFFALDRRGGVLFGVDAAPDRAAAERMLARLAEVLGDGRT